MRNVFRILFKVLGWICGFTTVFGGIGQLLHGRLLEPYSFLGWFMWLGLTIAFFWASKKMKKEICDKQPNETKVDAVTGSVPNDMHEVVAVDSAPIFDETLMRDLILDCDILGKMFMNSPELKSSGNGHLEKMYETMMSYKCIFIYFFSEVFHYGKSKEFLTDEKQKSRYLLSYNLVFTNKNAMKQCLLQLPTNWDDVITVIHNLELVGEREIVKEYDNIIANLTAAFKTLSTYKH